MSPRPRPAQPIIPAIELRMRAVADEYAISRLITDLEDIADGGVTNPGDLAESTPGLLGQIIAALDVAVTNHPIVTTDTPEETQP